LQQLTLISGLLVIDTSEQRRENVTGTTMFHDIPERVLSRMRELEQIDLRDRIDGTHRMKQLSQIPSEVGRFIAILAAAAPDGRWIEIGTGAGYSTLWLALACRASKRKATTFEILRLANEH
jgi:caffeoyl-CoA O-methyltransferase